MKKTKFPTWYMRATRDVAVGAAGGAIVILVQGLYDGRVLWSVLPVVLALLVLAYQQEWAISI